MDEQKQTKRPGLWGAYIGYMYAQVDAADIHRLLNGDFEGQNQIPPGKLGLYI